MSTGLSALMAQADDESLALNISMYCGSVVISGRIIPPAEYYEITYKELHKQVKASLRGPLSGEDFKRQFDEIIKPVEHSLAHARHHERGVAVDEITLAEVKIFPAVGKEGTSSGGHTLPVARIPFASVDSWWIVGGSIIKGRGSSSMKFGFGFLLPLEL